MNTESEQLDSNNEQDKICESCGKRNPASNSFCAYCGTKLNKDPLSDIKDENKKKICPKCKNTFPENVRYCFFDGTPLQSLSENPRTGNPSINNVPRGKIPVSRFEGFEIPLRSKNNTIPIELLQTSMNLLVPSPRLPVEVVISSPGTKFGIEAPEPDYSLAKRLMRKLGLTKELFTSYVMVWAFVAVIYLLWLNTTIELSNYLYNYWLDLAFILWATIITLILILPVIFATKLSLKLQTSLYFKIEPTFLILNLFINLIIIEWGFPFPIVVFPGEIKIKTLPSKEELTRSIFYGMATAVFMGLIGATGVLLVTSNIFAVSDQMITIFTGGLIIVAMTLTMMILPFGTMFGRMAKEYSARFYWPLFLITMALLSYAVSFIGW